MIALRAAIDGALAGEYTDDEYVALARSLAEVCEEERVLWIARALRGEYRRAVRAVCSKIADGMEYKEPG